MTKARIPHSFPDAMDKVKGLLGAAECARLATEAGPRAAAERTIYEWSNPDSGALPSLAQALAFDRAYRLAGGDDAPFRDAFAHQLEIEVEQADACRRQLAADAAAFAREAGEATAAIFVASQPGASPHDHQRALVEARGGERPPAPHHAPHPEFPPLRHLDRAGESRGTITMTRRRATLPSISCPHCGSATKIRTSEGVSPLLRQLRFRCENDECGHVFAADLVVVRTIVPSASPNPAISLPLAVRTPRPANDDNRDAANDDEAEAPATMKPG